MVVATIVTLTLSLPGTTQESILNDPSRPEAERERDVGSKPLELYGFFGIEPGMIVVDLMPGAGYKTHLLSKVVDGGRVLSGPDRRGRVGPRVDAAGLSNVDVFTDFGTIETGSVDVMVTVRNIHDLENRGATANIYAQYLAALKPAGIFGVVDARTTKPGVDESTHRINEQTVIDSLTAAGFELVARSEMLADPNDDLERSGRGSRWLIDRFVLKFRRPSS